MPPEHNSKSGEYWKEHVLSWEASAYYKDRAGKPAFWDWMSTWFRGQGMYVRMAAALDLIKPHLHGLTVLDIGCASGRFAFQLLEAGAQKVIGVDISPAAIQAADQRRRASPYADRLQFQLMDLTQPGLQLPQVDLITALGVIEYFDAATLADLLARFRTRYFLIDFPDSEGRRHSWWIWNLRRIYLRLNNCPGVYLYSQDEFRRLAAEQGFRDLWYTRHALFYYVTNLPPP